jgi:pimeloyl-ACP methyl ester carboxylesterase
MRTYPPCEGVEHTFVDAGGVRLHVATAGPEDGPAIVLLHGWPQHWWLWHEVIPALAADGRRVIAPDLRGFGWSEVTPGGYDKEQFATDVLALMDAMGIDSADIAGHDWGGWTAQLIALRAPERVRSLSIFNIAPVWPATGRTLRSLHRFLYQPLVAAPGLGARLQRSRLLWRAMERQGVPATSVAAFRGPFAEQERGRAGSLVYRTFLRREIPALLRGRYDGQRLTMPVRVLFGMDDAVIRRPMLDGFHDHADDVEITEVPGCGHFIVDERPQQVTQWLRDVLVSG